jgi:hypothetical protein
MEKLNKQIGDVKNGTGTLTKYLEDNNAELLDSLKNAKDNESAFLLVVDALKDTEDEFDRAKLATEVFGRSGQDLIKMTADGAQGISDLREEARKYGIISNEAAGEAEKFMDAEENLKRAMTGLSNEIGAALMPKFTDIIQGAADMVSGIDDLEGKLKVATAALITITGAMGAFFTIAKGKAAIDAVTLAVKGLTAALAANPMAAFAALLAAVAIPAIFALEDHMDKAANKVHYLSKELTENNKKYTEAQGLIKDFNKEKAIDFETTEKLIKLYPELTGVIKANATTYGEAADTLERLNRAKTVDTIDAQVKAYQDQLKKIDSIKSSLESMKKAQAMGAPHWDQSIDSFRKKLADLTVASQRDFITIGTEYQKLGQKLTDITQNGVFVEMMPKIEVTPTIVPPPPADTKATGSAIGSALGDGVKDGLKDAVTDAVTDAVKVATDEESAAWYAMWEKAMPSIDILQKEGRKKFAEEQEKAAEDARKARDAEALEAQNAEDLLTGIAEAATKLRAEKRKEIEDNENKARADAALALEENTRNNLALIYAQEVKDYEDSVKAKELLAKREETIEKARVAAAAQVMGALGQIIETAGQDNVGAAIAAKALAAAQAAINSYLAITQTLATPGVPWPAKVAAAVGIGAMGLAQQAKIISTAIPSAETGGRFEVPPTYTGVDSALMRVNAGEQVTVQPSGEGGREQMIHVTLYLDGQQIVDFINNKSDTGEIRFNQARNV